jgi:hypothetical protein
MIKADATLQCCIADRNGSTGRLLIAAGPENSRQIIWSDRKRHRNRVGHAGPVADTDGFRGQVYT